MAELNSRAARRALTAAPVAAGILYSAAWLTGLAVWLSNLSVAASGGQVIASYAGHIGRGMTQYVLAEGVAALALAAVVIALGRTALSRGARGPGRLTLAAGLGAATLSLLQCALGVLLVGHAVPAAEAGQAGVLFETINRLDGVKMILLATMIMAGASLARRARLLPRWLAYAGPAAAAALIVSGLGYLLLSNVLGQAAYLSLPLLLIWVTGAGVSLGRSTASRQRRGEQATCLASV